MKPSMEAPSIDEQIAQILATQPGELPLADDERAARLLGYVRDGDGWRRVPWRRALTWFRWRFIWKPA